MQRHRMTIAVLAALALALPGLLLAKSATKTWTWTAHKLRFELPADWKIREKGKKGYFLALGPKGGVMKISPWKDRRATAQSVAEKAFETYAFIDQKQALQKKALDPAKSGLDRYIIFGKGIHKGGRKGVGKGRPVTFGIIGLSSQSTTANAYARFWWFSDSPQAKTLSKETYEIAQSFRSL